VLCLIDVFFLRPILASEARRFTDFLEERLRLVFDLEEVLDLGFTDDLLTLPEVAPALALPDPTFDFLLLLSTALVRPLREAAGDFFF